MAAGHPGLSVKSIRSRSGFSGEGGGLLPGEGHGSEDAHGGDRAQTSICRVVAQRGELRAGLGQRADVVRIRVGAEIEISCIVVSPEGQRTSAFLGGLDSGHAKNSAAED